MEKTEKLEQNRPTEREQFETELAAINLLQQVGVSFSVPLKQEEIAVLRRKKSFLNKLLHPSHKKASTPEYEVKTRKIPNPTNPTEQIDYYEAEISIRPLYLETIDAIRAQRLKLDLQDSQLKQRMESSDPEDTYLLRYTKELCETVAIATVNTGDIRKHSSEIKRLAEFYHSHLTNARLLKLVSVIMMMQDVASFRASTRLILGLGTTAPSEANRVEKAQSKG